MDFSEKYRPQKLIDLVGNKPSIQRITEWAKDWSIKSKPLLIHGKPGIGKTTTAYALANDMKWEILELNASDQRTSAIIEEIAGIGSMVASMGGTRKLIVLDEADNLDRGGAKAIIKVIRKSRQPIILIANDPYGISSEIRSACESIQFKAVQARSIANRLKYICSLEKIECTDQIIRDIAENSCGDIRSAINMLYAASIGVNVVEKIHTSQKDDRATIFSLIHAVFGNSSDEEIMKISRDVNETPDTILQWIDGVAGDNGRQYLSRADEYLGYTYRRQYYALWKYATAVMLLGMASVDGKVLGRIMPPERWKNMASAKNKKFLRMATLNKVASSMHVSVGSLRENYLEIISALIVDDPLIGKDMELNAEQLNFFIDDQEIAEEMAYKEEKVEKLKKKKVEEKKVTVSVSVFDGF